MQWMIEQLYGQVQIRLRWELGNDKTTLFWEDTWCGNRPLEDGFPRLYRLAKLEKGRENFWLICPNRCRIDSIKSKPDALFWRPPPHGYLKFNACGIVNEDRAGCGGVLRD
ncbi:hypothetical protein PVK06_043498 [Gossypium arboreum]|uniref:Reverse transcriptase zinc-binding domain-containing protein n=1 Tax=Gossypium arboreum TaxID=29729 RepID=A0ABR0MQN8_GOSAR|nr:hypothetical protein PVK06_043498 [Gossypium arboreum]